MKKLIGLVLIAALALSAFSLNGYAAFQTTVLDDPTFQWDQNGILYREQTVQEGGVQALFYGEYNSTAPGAQYEWVIHSIRDGSETTLSTVMEIALDYEATTGRKVMLAANGDYFTANGSNVESYVNDGIVVSKGTFAHKYCIGFDNQGKVTVGRMTETQQRLVVTVNGQKYFFEIDRINEEPQDNEISIYINPGSHTVSNAGYYVCASDSANLNQYPVYGTSRRMTEGTVQGGGSFDLRSGQFAVVVKGQDAQFFYDNVYYGVSVDLVEIPAGSYTGCDWVLGGYDILVNGGTVGASFHTDNSGNANAPRTIFGFKADGTGFICCIDGRQAGYSVGITVEKEAELAKALGAVYALELDGGGSTTMVIRQDDTLTLRNKPSDGSMRRVSNAIMLVEKAEETVIPTPPPGTEPETEPTTVPATEPVTEPSVEASTAPDTTVSTAPSVPESTGSAPITEPSDTTPATQASGEPTVQQPQNHWMVYALRAAVAVCVIAAIVLVAVIGKKKSRR